MLRPSTQSPIQPSTRPRVVPRGRRLDHVDTWLFDLDNTLYPASLNLFTQVSARITGFLVATLGLAPAEAEALRRRYVRDHGSTLGGLMAHHGTAPATFLDHVHAIDMDHVAPAADLAAALRRLPGRKLVFTSASEEYAARILDRLGVADQFEAVFDIAAAEYRPKPYPATYDRFVARHAVTPASAVFFEDSARNLAPAAALGMVTVWVPHDSPFSSDGADGGFIDHVVDDLAAWLAALDIAAAAAEES